MDGFSKAFGERVRKARKDKGCSLMELSSVLFVDRTTIQRWENGSRLPSLPMVCVLAKHLGVSVEWLATGEEI